MLRAGGMPAAAAAAATAPLPLPLPHQAATKCSSRCSSSSSSSRRRAVVAQAELGRMRFLSVGSAAPPTVISNLDLETLLEGSTSDEWISQRTGIRRRHVLGKGETLGELAVRSSRAALEMAGLGAEELDLVLFATSSPDDLFGGACQVRRARGRALCV